jgi:hypothetical protein
MCSNLVFYFRRVFHGQQFRFDTLGTHRLVMSETIILDYF